MDYDAFTGGVEPGGLRTKNQIRILICYLLSSVDAPLSREDVIHIMQDNGLANYFEIADAVAELLANGNLMEDPQHPELLTATPQAHMIAKQLDAAVPIAVREHAVSAAANLLAAAKRERENKVEIRRTDNGYNVVCHVSGGDMELMSFTLYVPDLYQARMVKRNFHRAPENVYRILLAAVTNNTDLVADILKSAKGKAL
ncbi:DUF4364 family protein [Anaeromassilibacillus senegalensis]|uniref:DUF4364 family protein n=1 Tax=Anaeromassilibacillus senegalensis TaxID=1673717 RepID=UPI0006827BA2|nr:DUF4364 family protein [Anaeromassilibacillus senegalensis]